MRRKDASQGAGRPARIIVVIVATWVAGAFANGGESDGAASSADRKWIKELQAASDRGDLKATAQLGEMLVAGEVVTREGARGLALLETAARGGESHAWLQLGFLLMDGKLVSADRTQALAYFRAAAVAGEMEALRAIGDAYSKGMGVKRDYAEALAWLILAKERGDDSDAIEQVREHIQVRHPEWITNGERRAPEIKAELAKSSLTAVLPTPTKLVYIGPTDETGPTQAPILVGSGDKSPQGGGSRPATKIAPFEPPVLAVPVGPAVKVTLATGRIQRWVNMEALQKAADRGDPVALAAQGQLILEGKELPADPELAVIVLERAAKAGSADAAQLLAEIYQKGVIVVGEPEKAFTYALQAARGGALGSIYNVGGYYANGRGTPRDFTQALAWLLVAKHYRVDPGQAQRISEYLTKTQPAQIAVAEQRALEFVREIEETRRNLK